jgi:hypothetical protein
MRVLVISALLGALGVAGAAPAAQAQGGMGGMGGMGGRGGGRGGPGGQGGSRVSPVAGEMAKHFEQMASLKPVLKDVKVDGAAKDSLRNIEKAYKPRFKDYGDHLKKLFEGDRPPAFEEIRKLHDGARTLQDDEFAAARAVIAESERDQFDRNVTALRDEERKRQEEQRRRRN